MARRRASKPTVTIAGDGPRAAMFAAAAEHLGWVVTTGADLAVVDTPPADRAADAIAFLARGVDVVLTPGLGVDDLSAVASATAQSPASLVLGEPFPTAPAVQRWFAELGGLTATDHLSGRAARAAADPGGGHAVALDGALLAVLVLSARVAGWGAPAGVEFVGAGAVVAFAAGRTARVHIDPPAADRPPHWELQAADARAALRVEMLPRPSLERDGAAIPLGSATDPAEAFGAAPLLRTFRADIVAGRRPVLDARFALTVERLRAQLSPA